jgi:hypothetical protein
VSGERARRLHLSSHLTRSLRSVVLAAAILSTGLAAPALAAGYLYRKQITVDNTKVAGTTDLLNFPLLVSLTDPDLRTTANGGKVENPNGYDIIFRAADTVTNLDHEVESYDGTTGTLVAWVRIPVLDYNDDTRLYLYYGNSGISTSQENPTAVWDANYRAVWHLNETVTDEATGAVHNDSTANNRDGTQSQNDDIPGKIAKGQDFDGTDHINLGSTFPGLGATFTIEGWVWFDGFASFPTVFARHNFGSLDYRVVHDNGCGTPRLRIDISYDGSEPGDAQGCPPAAIATGQWYHFAAVKSATELRMYLNAVSGTPTATSGTVNNNAANATRMARRQDGSQGLDGRLDEVRVSDLARSGDWILTEYNNQNSPSTFYTVGPQQVMGDCPPLNVTQGAGTFTVAAPDSFEMTFSTATGGSAQTFYDLSLDPSRTYDLAGGVARIEALYTDGLDPGGGFYNTDQNDQGAKVDVLEATPTRVRLRQEAFYQQENGTDILAGVKGFGDYSVYPSGRMALRWNRKTTSAVTYTVEELDLVVHSTAGAPLNAWLPYSETDGTFPNNPGTDDFTLAQIDTAEVKTDFLNILYKDWTTTNGYVATADFTQWWGGGGEEWQIALWEEATGAVLPAGSSEVWNFLTYFKPTTFLNNTDPAVLSRRNDYRGPDTLSVTVGSGWFDADENTVSASDFYNESEGVYLLTCDPAAGLTFDINGGATTRYHPFFKIRQWRSLQDPSSVTLEGVPLTNDSSYKADVKPLSRAHFAQNLTWSSTLQSAAAVTSPDVGSAGAIGGTTDFLAGRFGNGARFDADGEYLSFPPPGNFNPAEGAIEFWYRPFYDYGGGDPLDDYGFFGYWIDANNYFYAFHEPICGTCDGSDEGIKFIIMSGGVLFYKVVQAPPFTPVYWRANEWVHLRFVWDNSPQRLEVYINGTPVGPAETGSYPAPVGLDTAFYIGDRERNDLFTNNANGIIDEFRIYSSPDAPAVLAYGGLTTNSSEYLADGSRNFTLGFAALDGSRRGRYAYFGADSKFRGLNVALATTGAGASPDLQWQYWNGTTWANLESFGFVDQTSSFTQLDGTIYWTSDPTNWSPYSVNGGPDLYYVRAYLASGSYTTSPVEALIKTDILLFQYCGDITANAQTFAFGLPPPTAVELVSFSARGMDGGVELFWETASELNNLGFHIYRSTSERGRYERITAGVIAGLGSSASGKVYRYLDTGVVNGTTYYYRLEDIETSGKRTLHGPISARPEAGAPSEPSPETGGSERSEVYGEPSGTSLRILRSDRRGVELELVTGGFAAERQPDGSVRLSVPGFVEEYEAGAPAIPLKRAWVEVLAGRTLRVASVRATDVAVFPGLRPVAAGSPELAASSRGTVRAGSRRRDEAAAFQRPGLYPEEAARLLSVGFQADVKKAWVELAPLRWDCSTGRLLLARRLVVRLVYMGRDSAELTLGGSRGRRLPQSESQAGRQAIARLRVKQAGLYALGFEQVFGAHGRAVDATRLRLARQGEAVAFHVEPKQDVFGRGSTLYFVSEGASLNPYGQEAVYELELAKGGIHMPVKSGAGAGERIGYGSARLLEEQNRYYQAGLLEAEDLWLWDVLMAPVRKAYGFELKGLASVAAPGRLTVWLQGASDFETRPDHHLRVYLNGILLGERSWDGKKPARVTADLPPGVLREGTNELGIENVGDTGAPYSMVFLDGYEVSYPQSLAVAGGQTLEGTFDRTGVAEVAGLTGAAHVLDVTDSQPMWLAGWTAVEGTARFGVEAGRRYLVVGEGASRRPEVSRATLSGLRSESNRADYLVVGPRELLEAMELLLELRRSQGLRVKAVPIEDVYAEFGYGETRPEALRDFVSYAYHHWTPPAPRYVLLVGDGSYDFKDYLATGVANAVPPLVVKTTYLWTASDPTYASVNGDDVLPDMAIGRLPARTVDDVRALVEKILAYEHDGLTVNGPSVLVADNADRAGDFEADAEELAATVLAGRTPRRVYLGRLGAEATRNAVREAFDDGAALLSYAGHGGIHLWAQENIFNSGDVAALAPQSQQPVVLTLNCLNGYFHFPYFDALAEALLRPSDKGAIAVLSPSGLSVNEPAHVFHKAIVHELLDGGHPRLGDAVLAAQAAYAATGVFPELLRIYHLFGDPALRLR